MIGVQCYPVSLLLEGADEALAAMRRVLGAEAVLMCVNEVECPEVFAAPLPHFSEGVYFTPNGEYCFEADPSCYERNGLVPERTRDSRLRDFDAVRALVDAARRTGLKSYAWIQTFHLAPELARHPEAAMVDFRGCRLRDWACPSNPTVVGYNLALIEDLLTRYELTGVFLDRFRFPSPYDGISAFFTCFCERCRERASALGIDYQRCLDDVRRIYDWMQSVGAEELETWRHAGYGSGMSLLETHARMPGLFTWLTFRQHLISDYVGKAASLLRGRGPKRELGLDIWPPAYALPVGQDWQGLAALADWVKPILYPMRAGPASLAGELVAILRGWRQLNPTVPIDSVLEVLYRFFGFESVGARTVEEIGAIGFPPPIYPLEMRRGRALAQNRVPIFAGCPIVDTGPEEVADRVEAAARTDADGIFYYCYDYATWENLEISGKVWREIRGRKSDSLQRGY